MRRFNIYLHTYKDGEHQLRQVDDTTWEITQPRRVNLLRKADEYVGVSFQGHKTFHLGDGLSNRTLTQITRDQDGRIFLTLSER